MKHLFSMLSIIAAILLLPSFKQDDSYQIDLKKSNMTWRMPITGGEHFGTIGIKSGYLVYNGNTVTAGTFIIDLNSIKDLDLEKEKQPKIEAHIKSPDFFETATYPFATFVIEGTATNPKKGLMAYGKLTIKNITHPIAFPFSLKKFDDAVYVVADKVEVSRKAYGITIKGKGIKGHLEEMVIDDAFNVGFSVVLRP